ncbi:GNAT family N-acetyltransferase [Qipengyuania aquimaris]|uniref:GNAT family N-acetyltransferase n=1 Tax=Qipengyuania aquimaris TaxID=255984 RepID=UPI002D809973|nr:GNAT family N-acetyltransferase [Qipengyuania aquimaris]
MVITVSYHDTVTKLQGLGSPEAGPFDRYEWYRLLETHGAAPLVAVGTEGERTVALPLTRGQKGLEPLTNWFAFSWKPLASGGDTSRILVEIAHDLKKTTHRLDLYPLAAEDGCYEELCEAFEHAGWSVHGEQCDENHVLYVQGRSFAEYWNARPGRMKTTVKRKAPKVDIEISTEFQKDEWENYEAIYDRSWKPREERADILKAFARQEDSRGAYRLGIARVDGDPVAAQFWSVENGVASIHKLAHLESAEPYSAGTVLTAALFEYAIDVDRVDLIDFGTGSDSYKRDWMEECRPRFHLTCLDIRQPAAWPALAKRMLGRLAPRKAHG